MGRLILPSCGRLLELVAEDNAIEDTVYHLGRAFNSDTQTQEELERFLKVRFTSLSCFAFAYEYIDWISTTEDADSCQRAVYAEVAY